MLERHADQGRQHFAPAHVRPAELPADFIVTAVDELLIVRWCPHVVVAPLPVLKLWWEIVSNGRVNSDAQVDWGQEPPIEDEPVSDRDHPVATVVDAKLSSAASYVALFVFCLIATSSYITLELYAGFRPEQSQVFLAKVRTWIDGHTDQVIIIGSLLLGFWLIGNSIYLIVT